MPRKFSRKVEDFICANCNRAIEGNGYTNHCPYCLFSLHVDENPGDRASLCRGILRPVAIEKKGENLVVVHRCDKCGEFKKCKVLPNDSFDEILKIMRAQE